VFEMVNKYYIMESVEIFVLCIIMLLETIV
jgi:hypothetical protein